MAVPVSFALGVDPIQESLTEICQRALDTSDLDDVRADCDVTAPLGIKFRNVQALALPSA
jgi:hypothetical protein